MDSAGGRHFSLGTQPSGKDWGKRSMVEQLRCLEGRIRSRVHVRRIGRCCCIAHRKTSWISNSFGICIGNARRPRAINRIHDFKKVA